MKKKFSYLMKYFIISAISLISILQFSYLFSYTSSYTRRQIPFHAKETSTGFTDDDFSYAGHVAKNKSEKILAYTPSPPIPHLSVVKLLSKHKLSTQSSCAAFFNDHLLFTRNFTENPILTEQDEVKPGMYCDIPSRKARDGEIPDIVFFSQLSGSMMCFLLFMLGGY